MEELTEYELIFDKGIADCIQVRRKSQRQVLLAGGGIKKGDSIQALAAAEVPADSQRIGQTN